VFSFNGNKIITTGGGGMLITDHKDLAQKAKHLTTTARIPHKWEYIHDDIGYNYRLTNIQAALGCAQMEKLAKLLENKRQLAESYANFFEGIGVKFFEELEQTTSNYWLNAIILKNKQERDDFLEYTHQHGVMTRPIWRLMNKLPMFEKCQHENLDNAEWLEARVVNIPSSFRMQQDDSRA
jgi:dTDP-4-amino-4,6-dideoxygalactose transaminase